MRRSDAATDPEVLRRRAYGTTAHLEDRASIYRFRTEPLDLVSWVLDQVSWPSAARVLDVGCGPAQYSRAVLDNGVAVTSVDLSEGMAQAARAGGLTAVSVADASHLPFADGSFERVIAAHMLYHLPDRLAGAAELARVTGPDGVVLVVTNGAGHLRELRTAMGAAGGISAPVSENFLLDDHGREVLAGAFATVEVVRHRGRIEVPDVGPVVRYAESCRALDEPSMAVPWEEMMPAFTAFVAAEVERRGSFAITTDTGLFRCRTPLPGTRRGAGS